MSSRNKPRYLSTGSCPASQGTKKHFPRSAPRRVKVINSPPSGGSKEATAKGSCFSGRKGGVRERERERVCQREPNEIVLKFHLVARLRDEKRKGGGKGRLESDVAGGGGGWKQREQRAKRAGPRILKLVALGQNEGKSSVYASASETTNARSPDTGRTVRWKYEILRKIRTANCFYTLIRIYAPAAPTQHGWNSPGRIRSCFLLTRVPSFLSRLRRGVCALCVFSPGA